jgi:hypothetical protein
MANRENPEITMIRYVTYEVISANHRTPPHAPARVPARAILILTALDSSLPPPSIPDFHMYSTVEINAPVLTAAVAFPGHRHKRRPTIDARAWSV